MEDVKEIAANYFKLGNNCVETVLKTSNDVLELQLPEETFRMASILGGGIGGSGCACGALTGASLVLGALTGRSNPQEKTKQEMNAPVHEFYNIWIKHFGVACCRVLKSPAHGVVPCSEIMAVTVEMLVRFVKERGIR
ncbi:MAG: C-GCAxxG-C-C family protein [Megasphaera sp.]|jgi:C_GCAxxG_C_C family probable redox protein|nr:C-GCAxxG-C-C family protein [Megasphaera sp.]MCH4188207.1 C-GCAxxG-C-C family protein [Megasphaera sp.]MCH4218114.1 C-GCAxxG-C-C family protein [Megasphaera sp.]